MNHLQIWKLINENLLQVDTSILQKNNEEDKETLPIEQCDTWEELCEHWSANFFFTKEIEYTLATMMAVILSTSTEGGQLGLRVLGPPGGAKSTLSECLSQATELVHAVSKFTGIVSGWGQMNNKDQMAERLNHKCLMIKDADPLMQLSNRDQIESELRDGLGDAVIRASYRTGRELEVRTLFTAILCGTKSLRGMDNALLGARFLDIVIHDPNSPTRDIVKSAINSQSKTIISQLTKNRNRKDADHEKRVQHSKIKPIIAKLAPKTIAFLRKKKELIESGDVDIKEPTPVEVERIFAKGELIAYLRAKPDRDKSGELKYRIEKELSTRLGEQLIRLYLFLQVVLNDV